MAVKAKPLEIFWWSWTGLPMALQKPQKSVTDSCEINALD
jgi:hypothetical protein